MLYRFMVEDSCDPTHLWVKAVLLPGVRKAKGIYEIQYDFISTQTGEYLDRATYFVTLCVDFDRKIYKAIHFEDP